MEIHTIKVPEQIEQHLFNSMLEKVSDDTCHTVNKFRRRTDAQNTLTGELLVRWLASKYTGLHNGQIRFARNQFGKPFVIGQYNFHFNLSHSGCWVACAIDNSEVGIDVEEIRQIDFSVAWSFFSSAEYEDLMHRDESERLSYFYELWTLKESYVKAIGKGLSEPLPSFSIQVRDHDIHCTAPHNSTPALFQKWDFLCGYKLAACSFRRAEVTTLYMHHIDDLLANV
ncbi:MAG: 4'-phosphopantetheinyl transferase superfamily protein [Williamsia sp.]|nr:4'-phosphopantetheinyl transferase superfamily protein [Williamsia sp.]